MSEQFESHAELPPEPILSEAETRRLVERLEAQIKETEQLERAIATRPQPSAEPVAWMYQWRNKNTVYMPVKRDWADYPNNAGWTETPLYAASALEAARREGEQTGLEKAAVRIEQLLGCTNHAADAIRALKDNPNAG